MARKIIFPTDFSHLSDGALAEAITLAHSRQATLVILHVAEPPHAYGGGEMYYGLPEPDDSALERMLQEIVVPDASVTVKRRLVTGDPATEIVHVADEEQADLIVMATHGRTGVVRILMGSVAEAVVRHARCPVLIFKGHESAEAAKKPSAAHGVA